MGPVRMLATTEFEPTSTGTRIHMRFAAPKAAKERAIVEQMAPFLDEVMRTSAARLAEQLDEELERRDRDAPEEPDLPRPRPKGVLAALPPGA